jgi:hypothetical protein
MSHSKEQIWLEALPDSIRKPVAGSRRLSTAGSRRQWHKGFFIDFFLLFQGMETRNVLYGTVRDPLCHCLRVPATGLHAAACD